MFSFHMIPKCGPRSTPPGWAPLCFLQVCLQMFQLLPGEVAPLVWEPNPAGPRLQSILQALVDVILGQVIVSLFGARVRYSLLESCLLEWKVLAAKRFVTRVFFPPNDTNSSPIARGQPGVQTQAGACKRSHSVNKIPSGVPALQQGHPSVGRDHGVHADQHGAWQPSGRSGGRQPAEDLWFRCPILHFGL